MSKKKYKVRAECPQCACGDVSFLGPEKLLEKFIGDEKEIDMTTPQHCPGFQDLKGLKSFVCKCPNCGKEKEVFSDEFDRTHTCSGCGKEIDFTRCTLDAGA